MIEKLGLQFNKGEVWICVEELINSLPPPIAYTKNEKQYKVLSTQFEL